MSSINLITKDENNKLQLNAAALDKLKNINEKFGVCVCVGPYRQGKSYLLSRIINDPNKNGFKVGHTDESCTKGVYMWSDPIKISTSEGPKSLLVLDTEGLESDESNEEWDSKLFMVSMLMSSMFLYNTKNALSSDAFKKLATITKFCEQVSISSKPIASAINRTSFRNQFGPTFTWVVRDFSLTTSMTPAEKLNKFLNPEDFIEKDSLSLKQNEKLKLDIKYRNQIRENVLDTFKTISCFYLPVPVVDGIDGLSFEEALASLNELPYDKLRPVFEKKLSELIKHISDSFELKQFNEKAVNGPVFVEFLKQIVDNINNNSKIFLVDTFIASIKIVASETLEKAIEKYEIEMEDLTSNNRMPMKRDLFNQKEEAIYNECVQLLETFIDNSAYLSEAKNKFEKFIKFSSNDSKGTYNFYKSMNENEIEKKNKKILEENWNFSLKSKMKNATSIYLAVNSLILEIEQFKDDIKTELFECTNFDDLFQNYENIIQQKIAEIKQICLKKEEQRIKRIEEEEKRRQEALEKKKIQDDFEALKKRQEETDQINKQLIIKIERQEKEFAIFMDQSETIRKTEEKNRELANRLQYRTTTTNRSEPIQSFTPDSSFNSSYGETYRVNTNGTPDMRCKENRVNLISKDGVHLKKDGTPDMRYKENRVGLVKHK